MTPPKLPDRLTFDDSGLKVSPIFLGMVRSVDTACAASDAGIKFFFFSSDYHWPHYEVARWGLERLLARGKAFESRS